MRRIVPLLTLVAGITACTPSGNTDLLASVASVRIGNFAADAPALTLATSTGNLAGNTPFGSMSIYKLVKIEEPELFVRRSSDGVVLGSDSITFNADRHYTMFAVGTVAHLVPFSAIEDTVPPSAGTFKVRFVHGIHVDSTHSVDFYLSAPGDSIIDISPMFSSVGYASATGFSLADTVSRRLRLTLAGQDTTIYDSTFATAFTSASIITMVATDKLGGGTPIGFHIIVGP